jgi:formate/nitrite transporter FocA (FNT family)
VATTRRWGRKPVAAIVGGVIVGLIAFFMLQSGNEHRRDYEAFQDCRRHGTGICILEQKGSDASDAADYKRNYENQLLIGTLGLILGGGLVAVGGVLLLIDRSRTSVAGDLEPPDA